MYSVIVVSFISNIVLVTVRLGVGRFKQVISKDYTFSAETIISKQCQSFESSPKVLYLCHGDTQNLNLYLIKVLISWCELNFHQTKLQLSSVRGEAFKHPGRVRVKGRICFHCYNNRKTTICLNGWRVSWFSCQMWKLLHYILLFDVDINTMCYFKANNASKILSWLWNEAEL